MTAMPSSSINITSLPDMKSGESTATLTMGAGESMYVITGHATDVAGNVAASIDEIRVTLDTSPPAASFETETGGEPSSIESISHFCGVLGCLSTGRDTSQAGCAVKPG